MKPHFVYLLAAGLLLFVVLACGDSEPATVTTSEDTPSEPDAAPTAVLGAIGETVTQSGVALSVLGAGHRAGYYVAEVTVENVGDEEESVNILFFGLRDGDGFEYEPDITPQGIDQNITTSDLLPGDKARGFVAFEGVPEDAAGLRLHYDMPFGASIRFQLTE